MRAAFLMVVLLPLMASAAQSMENTTPSRRMIIIGASYAAGWERPPFEKYLVINKGVGGDETSQVVQRFDRDVISAAPATTIIWGHINDIHRAPGGDMKSAATKAKRNLADIASRASSAGIRVVMATEVTLSRPRGFIATMMAFAGKLRGKQDYRQQVSDQVIEVNRFVRELAADKGYILLDIEAALRGDDGYRRPEFDAEDTTHINPAGYAAISRYASGRVPGP